MRIDTGESAARHVFPTAPDAKDKISLQREDEADRDREECEQKEGEDSATRKDKSGDERRPPSPVKEKVGEGRDNLRRREEWYQKRSGKRPS